MVRKLLLLVSGVGALITTVLWLAQLRGPIVIADGPTFRDARWVLDPQWGWGMYDPTGAEPVHSKTESAAFYAIEVPSSEAPPMLPAVPDKSYLIGVGFGGLHLGQAYFYDVPNPVTAPAAGMTYVSSAHTGVSIPLWLLLLAFIAYPAVIIVKGPIRRYRRLRLGQCLRCGYSLTGNSSGVCPECGDIIAVR